VLFYLPIINPNLSLHPYIYMLTQYISNISLMNLNIHLKTLGSCHHCDQYLVIFVTNVIYDGFSG
jgi:hypothetical protein